MFFVAIYRQCVNAVSGILHRTTPERFLKWAAEKALDPTTICEALSDPEGILPAVIFFLMVSCFLVLVMGILGPFLEMLLGDRGRA